MTFDPRATEHPRAKMPRVSTEFINGIPLPIILLLEEEQIANHLNIQTRKVDTFTEKAKQAIKFLKEHRTVLISAAVTGKIDARENRKEPYDTSHDVQY